MSIGTAKITQAAINSTGSNKATLQAQQFASSEADLIKSISYTDLTAQSRADISDSGFQKEVILSDESDYSEQIKQKTATINVYKGSESFPRSTIKLTRYSVEQKASGVPVGTVIAWASSKNPSDGTWLECNGQSCAAYSELSAVLGKTTVPDYRGVFLRGLGFRVNNGINHQSAALGVFQNMAFPETMSGKFCAVNTGGPAPTGPFKQIGSYADYGLQDNTGFGSGFNKQIEFNLSNSVPTANELRPVNIAVRYFIKAA